MPNRILREAIIDSEAVNSLSEGAEVFYRRLMSVVDDFGRFDGRVAILKGRLYALQSDRVREASLVRWIAECETANLIRLYEHNGKPYLLLHKLGEPRAKASKYPPPPADAETCQQTTADANICAQTQTYVPYSYSDSTPYSDSVSRPTPDSGGRSAPDDLDDPLRSREKVRKEFEAAWNAAGLMKLDRLTRGLWTKLEGLMLDADWRKIWRDALVRAGQSPFLARGEGSKSGPMDPAQFLRDDDFAHRILRGQYDPRETTAPESRTKNQIETDRILAEAYRKRGMTPP